MKLSDIVLVGTSSSFTEIINSKVSSNDSSLDTLQKVVDYCKSNKQSIINISTDAVLNKIDCGLIVDPVT